MNWYKFNSIFGYKDCMFYVNIGSRMTGKSYAAMDFCLNQYKKYHRQFVWIRLSAVSRDKMLANNADKLIDMDLRRKYNLDICRKDMDVYEVLKRDNKGKIIKKRKMCKVLALSEMAKEKGVALFDKDYKGWYNIVCDEFVREKNEKETFDVRYNLANTLENLIRVRKNKVRIVLICNACSEIGNVLAGFNFIPFQFGRWHLKKKKAIIDYCEPDADYKAMRDGSALDILMSSTDGNTSNIIERDMSRIWRAPLRKPIAIVKFSKDKNDWYILHEHRVISRYKGQPLNNTIAMRPYISEVFDPEQRDMIYQLFHAKNLYFKDLITQELFMQNLIDIKMRG